MGAARLRRGGVGKAHLVACVGVVCLVSLAVFQALRDTHPDAVAVRHDGSFDFLSRTAHERGYARSEPTALSRIGGRVAGFKARVGGSLDVATAGGRDADLVVNPFHPSGYSDARSLENTIAGVGAHQTRGKGEASSDVDNDEVFGTHAASVKEDTENVVNRRDETLLEAADELGSEEFPKSLRPIGTGGSDDFSDARALKSCVSSTYKPHTELWGAVVSGGDENIMASADLCCQSCARKRACTVWVWHPSSNECWLKSDDDPNPEPHSSGDGVAWTSGLVAKVHGKTVAYAQIDDRSADDSKRVVEEPPVCLHTVLTSSGNAYMNWQTRIMYQTYKKHASEPGSILKAFTRILHRGRDDELMSEVPTMRFDPNQVKCDVWCDYPVADRSLAVAQWSRTANSQQCSHVMMVETDYIYVKSPPPAILLPKGRAMGFEYQYIGLKEPNMLRVVREYLGEVGFDAVPKDHPARQNGLSLPRTGNAPSCLTVEDLRKAAPLWATFVERTETPEATRKALGWLRDMYAYDAAVLIAGIEHEIKGAPGSLLMAQPPADDAGVKTSDGTFHFNAFLLHYTWGPEIYDQNEKKLWVFDKRAYGGGQYKKGPYELVKLDLPPEWAPDAGLQLQTFFNPRALTESKLELLRVMITEFNEAVEKLPRVPVGFDTLQEAEKAAE